MPKTWMFLFFGSYIPPRARSRKRILGVVPGSTSGLGLSSFAVGSEFSPQIAADAFILGPYSRRAKERERERERERDKGV